MQTKTSDQIVNLTDLEEGRLITLVITKAGSPVTLEFRNQDDGWTPYPGVAGTPVGGAVVISFRCISGRMRVKFQSAPTADFYLSTVTEASAEF